MIKAMVRCAGCGLMFDSLVSFELHATGNKLMDPKWPRSCRGAADMHKMGMSKQGSVWTTINRSKPRR